MEDRLVPLKQTVRPLDPPQSSTYTPGQGPSAPGRVRPLSGVEGSSEAYAPRCSSCMRHRPPIRGQRGLGWSGRCARLRIRYWPVGEKDDGRVERGRRDQAHPDLAAVEGPVAAAPDSGVDPEVDLVGESLFGELVASSPQPKEIRFPRCWALSRPRPGADRTCTVRPRPPGSPTPPGGSDDAIEGDVGRDDHPSHGNLHSPARSVAGPAETCDSPGQRLINRGTSRPAEPARRGRRHLRDPGSRWPHRRTP
jgi:hypothetical protein